MKRIGIMTPMAMPALAPALSPPFEVSVSVPLCRRSRKALNDGTEGAMMAKEFYFVVLMQLLPQHHLFQTASVQFVEVAGSSNFLMRL
jgi:hypothetical protein